MISMLPSSVSCRRRIFRLGDPFEPSAMEVVGFEAAIGRRAFVEKGLEHATVDAHHALILADSDAERDAAPVGVPTSIFREPKEHTRLHGPTFC